MRQRKIKNLDEKLAGFSQYTVQVPEKNRGIWSPDKPFYVEIGCGKGQFITKLASLHPDHNYLAIEGHGSVALHALEKIESAELTNVRMILQYINGMDDVFADQELDGIYLNFSDPWPKERHAKRRLTCGRRLSEYARVIRPDGRLEFKTDNDALFEYSLEQILLQEDFEIAEVTRDLHATKSGIITTEYEDKFAQAGKNINYVCLCRR